MCTTPRLASGLRRTGRSTARRALKSRIVRSPRTVRRSFKLRSLLWSIALVSACAYQRDDAATFGGDFMLSQAHGIELGTNPGALARERENLLSDTYSTWEQVDSTRSNVFWFSRPAHPNRADGVPERDSHLSAVTMTQQVPGRDTTAYVARLDSIARTWTALANRGPETLTYRITPVGAREPVNLRVLVWRAPPVTASLEYAPLTAHRLSTYLIRATVQDERLPLEITHPYWPRGQRRANPRP